MTKRKSDFTLTTLEDLFTTQEMRAKVQNIPLEDLQPFENHPYKVADDEEMKQMIESIERVGTISPALARPLDNGKYELISGHRRMAACKALGLETMPVIVRDMSDDEAVITMADANLQRETILPSEKAFAYKMKMEALKHQGRTSGQVVQKWSREMRMALYHFNLKQISRNNGQSVISSAAYRAGEKLYSSYYGEVSDYTRKSGVVLAEIHLPPHAPERFKDRETLWNELEWTEKHKGAQLAHSFEIAFMNEFSMEENIAMGRKFVEEQLVSRGMIADLCIHNPDKGKDADQNPHMHILVPIRLLNEDGSWGIKEKKVPVLDAEGNPVFDKRGKQKMAAVSTTGWSDKETLLEMRKAWADMNNELLAQKGFSTRISEKSYAELGLDLIPTIHEGPNIRAMEKKGIKTTLGTINRLICWINGMAERTKEILAWLVKEKEFWEQNLEKQSQKLPEPTLASYLQQYMEKRNENAEGYKYGTQKAKTYNLKAFAESIAFLQENDLKTPADLEEKILDFQKEIAGIQTSLSASQKKLKRARQFIRDYENYEKLKPIQQTYNKKYFAKEAYRKKHAKELNQYQAVNRRLKAVLAEEGIAGVDDIDLKQWEAEVKKEQKQVNHFSSEKKKLEEKLRPFEKVKACVDSVSTYHMVEEIEPVSVMNRLHEKQNEIAEKNTGTDRMQGDKERQDADQNQGIQSNRTIRKKKSYDMEL